MRVVLVLEYPFNAEPAGDRAPRYKTPALQPMWWGKPFLMGKEVFRLVFYRVKSLFPIKIQNLCGQKVFVAGKAVDTNSWRSDGAKHSIVASSDSCPVRFRW